MKARFIIVITTFFSVAFAFADEDFQYIRHERLEATSPWIKRDAVPAEHVLPMRLGLTQSNLDRGHDLLMEVSNPRSSNYGKYYTVDQIHDLFAPSSESVATVRRWLLEAGVREDRISQSANKQWLQFQAEAGEVEPLLNTKFHFYEHRTTGQTSIGCDEYFVKHNIHHHIDYITPGVKMVGYGMLADSTLKRRALPSTFKRDRPLAVRDIHINSSSLDYCDNYISPACIMAMYNITKGTTATKGNELGVFEESPQGFLQSDLDLFFANAAPQIPNGTSPIVHGIDGGGDSTKASMGGGETTLDLEVAYPLIYPQKLELFITDSVYETSYARVGRGLFNTFLDAIDGSYCTYSAFGEKGNNNTVDPHYPSPGYEHPLQCGVFKPTNVISFSYDFSELQEGTTPAYQKRQCNEYMKLGMQGVSIVIASGDEGVESFFGCPVGPHKQRVFNPEFPSTCPYVTAVGATTTLSGAITKDRERAATHILSGGGFSNNFARPSYQQDAVETYFRSPRAPTYPFYSGSAYGNGQYNRSGRGYPDVSAVGQSILNFVFGGPELIDGTSASAPIFAAILTRINEERLKAGKSTVGFVNPVLYQNPQAFHDVTVGNNPGCETNGFLAAPGWDPVTGLGTPDFGALLDIFMNIASGREILLADIGE